VGSIRTKAGFESPPERTIVTFDQQDASSEVDASVTEEQPQYGVGPFSIREVALVGTWLVAFVISFFPIYGEIGRGPSVWSNGIDWVLTIGVPTAAVFLIALRRLSPQGIRRVGSLGIDQFASVAFSVSTVLWLTTIWNSFITLANQRVFLATWVVWVEFFLMLAGVLLTVFAPLIAPFQQDFQDRAEVPAHRNARPVRAVSPRPATIVPAAVAEDPAAGGAYADYAAPDEAAGYAPADAHAPVVDDATDSASQAEPAAATAAYARIVDADPAIASDDSLVDAGQAADQSAAESLPADSDTTHTPAEAPRHQAFWALVPEDRDIVDEIGIPVFRIGPSAWALVIEDRGEAFVVRHEDGRIGYLHDVSGVTRG
jgi:hypothetical protein